MPKGKRENGPSRSTRTVRYVGQGAFVFGVPARDLAEADLTALTVEQLEQVAACRLYEWSEPAAPAPEGSETA